MLQRYTRAEMGRIWSEDARLARWLEIELALTDVLAERGEIPAAAARKLRAGARIDPARMRAIEDEVKHDVVAFVSAVAETVGDGSRRRARASRTASSRARSAPSPTTTRRSSGRCACGSASKPSRSRRR